MNILDIELPNIRPLSGTARRGQTATWPCTLELLTYPSWARLTRGMGSTRPVLTRAGPVEGAGAVAGAVGGTVK